MGVDWYVCDHCGDTFPDCGDYIPCGDECWKHWCSEECAEKDGYREDEDKKDEYGDPERSCKYCRGEDVEDSELLRFIIEHSYDNSRAALVKSYFLWKNP